MTSIVNHLIFYFIDKWLYNYQNYPTAALVFFSLLVLFIFSIHNGKSDNLKAMHKRTVTDISGKKIPVSLTNDPVVSFKVVLILLKSIFRSFVSKTLRNASQVTKFENAVI